MSAEATRLTGRILDLFGARAGEAIVSPSVEAAFGIGEKTRHDLAAMIDRVLVRERKRTEHMARLGKLLASALESAEADLLKAKGALERIATPPAVWNAMDPTPKEIAAEALKGLGQ
jgi:hypothetical protein